ncbi:MAG TPA: cytochrome o ubiquinol oxidase subunit IV [Chlamydiales bacterium]|jgi:cytochrome o ubiquinol oxidase operon protein cyoD|nr:cytochrome o ubiquinol oxidase subunit IV [Chlamydiales bacterium]
MQEHGTGQGTLKSYLVGFVSALALTLLAYALAVTKVLSGFMHSISIGFLGLVQVGVLLYLFLDLGKESKPQWNLLSFLFTIMVTVILVLGSIWIMYHLNYNLMGPM